MSRSVCRPVLGVLLSLVFSGANAATHSVPGEFVTIQAAIDAAVSGDLILVGPGTYPENLVVTKNVTIEGTAGAAATIVDGQQKESCIRVLGDSSTGAYASPVLRGLTFRNGWAYSGGGIYAWRGNPRIERCVIEDNWAYSGGGAYGVYGTTIDVVDSVVRNNTAFYDGGGGYGVIGGVTFTRCTITGNYAGRYGGASAGNGWCGSTRTLQSVVSGNEAGVAGGGIFSGAGGTVCNPAVYAENSLVVRNRAPQGGGVATGSGGRAWLNSVTVADNVADAGGGFWALEGTYHLILNSILYFNSTPPVFSFSTQWPGVANGLGGSDVEGTLPAGLQGDGTNISADPLFVDRAGGDYRLGPGSPCIDAGLSTAIGFLTPPPVDLAGDPRPFGAGHDVGAYEASLARVTAQVNVDPGTLNVCNANGLVTAYVALPAGWDPGEAPYALATMDGLIPAVRGSVVDGVLVLKFDRGAVAEYLKAGGPRTVTLKVSGEIPGKALYSGAGTIRTISPCN